MTKFVARRSKGPVVFINTRDFALECFGMSADDVGQTMLSLFSAVKTLPKPIVINDFSFVRKIIYSTPNRPSISPCHRKKILSRGSCVYCGSTSQLTVDHVIPLCRGGTHGIENYQCLCWPCNRKKWMHLECEL